MMDIDTSRAAEHATYLRVLADGSDFAEDRIALARIAETLTHVATGRLVVGEAGVAASLDEAVAGARETLGRIAAGVISVAAALSSASPNVRKILDLMPHAPGAAHIDPGDGVERTPVAALAGVEASVDVERAAATPRIAFARWSSPVARQAHNLKVAG